MARSRRDEQFEAWCRREWQTHVRRGYIGKPFHVDRDGWLEQDWPTGGAATARVIRSRRDKVPVTDEDLEGDERPGPWLLAALIAFNHHLAPAAIGELQVRLELRLGERPASPEQIRWQDLYAAELAHAPKLGMHLADEERYRAREWIFKRADLTEPEVEVAVHWLAGYASWSKKTGEWEGVRYISRALARRPILVLRQLEEARTKIAALGSRILLKEAS